jgi:phosphoglucosamine mutase
MILLDHMPTGDGQLSAVMLLGAVKAAGCPLSELRELMQSCPQVLKGVPATRR